MPRIHHQMGGKPINLNSGPDQDFPKHAACLGGYAPTVRKIDDDTNQDCAASRTDDGSHSLCGRRQRRKQSTNRHFKLRKSDGRQRAICDGEQRTLRSAGRIALQLPVTDAAAAHAAQTKMFNPDVAIAAPGFLRFFTLNANGGSDVC